MIRLSSSTRVPGFYWLSVNVLSIDLTETENRVWFNGVNGMFGLFAQMIGPFSSGWLVVLAPGGEGYKIVFLASLLLFVVSMCFIVRLPSYLEKGNFDWAKLAAISRDDDWRRLSLG